MLNMQRNTAAKTKIPNKGTRWRNAAIAAIATASFSLPVMSVAQAREGSKETPAAGMPLKKQVAKHREIYNATRTPSTINRGTDGDADGAFHGYFTLPQEDPAFHGYNGG